MFWPTARSIPVGTRSYQLPNWPSRDFCNQYRHIRKVRGVSTSLGFSSTETIVYVGNTRRINSDFKIGFVESHNVTTITLNERIYRIYIFSYIVKNILWLRQRKLSSWELFTKRSWLRCKQVGDPHQDKGNFMGDLSNISYMFSFFAVISWISGVWNSYSCYLKWANKAE